MGIDILWENESGDQLEEILDSRNYFGLALTLSSQEETVCLRFIDHYGNTVFNQRQIPIFISELQDLLQLVTPDSVANLQEKLTKKLQRHTVPLELIENRVKRLSAVEVSAHISKILDLANRSKGEIHTYLKLRGD